MNAQYHQPRGLRSAKCLGRWLAILPLALTFLPGAAFGLGSAIPNQNAEAIARGNAFIATADNPSAIYYNPAGITQLDGTRMEFGLHNLAINSQFETLDGSRTAHSEFAIASVPQFYATMTPKESDFSFGVGLYAPFGLGVKWPTNTPFNTIALESKLLYVTFNPVVAWKALPNLSIAVGPTVDYGKVTLRQSIGLSPGDEFIFEGTGWDFGGTFGLLWKPFDQWSVGINYRTPGSTTFDGHSRPKPYAAEEHTSATLNFPQSVGAGIAFRPNEQWNIETYLIWTDWDTLKTTTLEKKSGNIVVPFNWQSSFMTGIGATRYLNSGYFVSGGYFFSQNSTSTKNFTPLVPDTDLHVGSVGFGHKGEHWSYVFSGQIITGPDRVVSGSAGNPSTGQTADGKYHWLNAALNVSVGYRF